MAARPFLRKISRKIEELGGDEWIFDQIADARSIGSISEELGCSRTFLYTWRKAGGAERKAGWKEARKRSAEALIEDGLQVLDDLAEGAELLTSPEVTLANSRANYRREMAKLANPDLVPKSGTDINVNIGALHLDALRKYGGFTPPAEIEEAEVLSIEAPV